MADAYELLDAGDGRRLERFGRFVVDRPAPGATEPRRDPAAWRAADLRYDRDHGRGRGHGWTTRHGELPQGWSTTIGGLELLLRPTEAGQVGLFPEHAAMLRWLGGQATARDAPAVLHLFASTGLATLALARAGAQVAHLDLSRPAVAWARENATTNGLDGAPIRWLVDDARAFVAREIRRGRRYDGAVLDPPTYGHGESGPAWRIERDLPPLLADLDRLLTPDGFLLLTTHTPTMGPDRLGELVTSRRGRREAGPLAIAARSGARLSLGAFVRVDRAS